METTESDIGYPEDQPDEVGDETTKPERESKRKQGHGEGSSPETESGDGKATGNPRS
jgi:hypothetical protein